MNNINNNAFKAKSFLLVFALIALITVISCGESDDPSSPKDDTIAALEGSWSLSSESTLANTGVDVGSVGVTLTESGFTLTGGISSYVSGGGFSVDESGSLTNPTVTIASAELALDGSPTIAFDDSMAKITVSFTTVEASSRVSGLGSFVLIFVKQ